MLAKCLQEPGLDPYPPRHLTLPTPRDWTCGLLLWALLVQAAVSFPVILTPASLKPAGSTQRHVPECVHTVCQGQPNPLAHVGEQVGCRPHSRLSSNEIVEIFKKEQISTSDGRHGRTLDSHQPLQALSHEH